MKLRLFYNSAVIATILSYLLIFIGGLVRVSGAGMGCPNWPKCAEGWIPPTNIDINQINTTLAWIEFTNRMFGVILGISIIVLNVIAIFYFRKKYNSFSTNQASLLFYSILSLIFVVINGISYSTTYAFAYHRRAWPQSTRISRRSAARSTPLSNNQY